MLTVILSLIGLLAIAAITTTVVIAQFWPNAGKHPAQRNLESIAAENARIQHLNGF